MMCFWRLICWNGQFLHHYHEKELLFPVMIKSGLGCFCSLKVIANSRPCVTVISAQHLPKSVLAFTHKATFSSSGSAESSQSSVQQRPTRLPSCRPAAGAWWLQESLINPSWALPGSLISSGHFCRWRDIYFHTWGICRWHCHRARGPPS